MTVNREAWDSVIQQTEMSIDKMTISMEIQQHILKFAKERAEKYPKAKPIVEDVKDAGETKPGEEKQ